METKEIEAREVCSLFGKTRSWLSTQVTAKKLVPLRYTGKGYVYDSEVILPLARAELDELRAELEAREALLEKLEGAG